jgi:hypothetical protein
MSPINAAAYRSFSFAQYLPMHQPKRARQSYTDLVFRWLSACRDFPYAQHPLPTSNLLALWKRQEIIGTCAREFVRSNPDFKYEPRW